MNLLQSDTILMNSNMICGSNVKLGEALGLRLASIFFKSVSYLKPLSLKGGWSEYAPVQIRQGDIYQIWTV